MRLTLNFNVFIYEYDDIVGDDDNLEYYKFAQMELFIPFWNL